MKHCDLYTILKEVLKNGSTDLVTRQSGQLIRDRIEQEIEHQDDRAVIGLDFSRIGVIDYSCADEIIAKLVSRLLGGEYGERYILLRGINDNQRENIEAALERKELAVMAETREGRKLVVGSLHNYLRETLELIMQRGKVTARELAEALSLEANTSGTRLLNLYKRRLARRTEESRSSGRVWVYERL